MGAPAEGSRGGKGSSEGGGGKGKGKGKGKDEMVEFDEIISMYYS